MSWWTFQQKKVALLSSPAYLDLARVSNMRPPAEIDERPAAIDRRGGSLDLLIQNPHFELVVLEHLQQVLLRHLQSLERLLVLQSHALNRSFLDPQFTLTAHFTICSSLGKSSGLMVLSWIISSLQIREIFNIKTKKTWNHFIHQLLISELFQKKKCQPHATYHSRTPRK